MTGHDEPIMAAGAVVWRPGRTGGLEVGVIYRRRYDDWTLPKGKVEPGEHVLAAAVREVEEETGHRIVLGRPLPAQHYRPGRRDKIVRFWSARADVDAPEWVGNAEVDEVVFLPIDEAMRRLSHDGERQTVAGLLEPPTATTPLVILRHTDALRRSEWSGADGERPLTERGRAEADQLIPALSAFGVSRVVTSDAVRCADSVRGYADRLGIEMELDHALSEAGYEQSPEQAARAIRKLIADEAATVVCSHRPVLPELIAAAAADSGCDAPPEPLPAGGFHVFHHVRGSVVAIETHDVIRER
jgi:8-oxo-(d)GTP phosphatase